MGLNNIFKYCLKYCFRQPLYFVVLIASLTLIGLFPLLTVFAFNEQIKMVFDSSVALILVFSFLLAVLLSDGLIYKEIISGSITLLLSKPLERYIFLLGRFFGLLFPISVYILICYIATFISCYIATSQFSLNFAAFYTYYIIIFVGSGIGMLRNLLYKKSFIPLAVIIIISLLSLQLGYLLASNPDFFASNGLTLCTLIKAMFLLILTAYIMIAISISISTRFGLIINIITCSSLFVLGLVSDYLLGEYTTSGNMFFTFLYALIPNWQFFWVIDAATSGVSISIYYLLCCFVYTIFYTIFCGSLAFISLSKIELATKRIE